MHRRQFLEAASVATGAALAARPLSSQAASRPQPAFVASMNQVTTAKTDFRTAMDAYHKAGFRVVEVSLGSVEAFAKKESLPAVRRLLNDNGLEARCADGIADLVFPRSPDREKRLDQFKRMLELTAELDIHRFLTWSAIFEEVAAADYDGAVANLREAGELARQHDVIVGVEFIRWSKFLGCLETTANLIHRANHPNIGVLLDTFHFYSGISKLTDFDPLRPGDIVWVHIDDVPAMPRERLQDKDRVYAGEGVMPFKAILPALARVYRGPVSLELFQYGDQDPYEVARRGFAGLSRVLAQSGVAASASETSVTGAD